MGHNNNIYDFCGEISEISPNTLSKVAPKTTFVGKTVRFPKYMNIMLVKHQNLITFGGDCWKTTKFLMRVW